MTRHRAQPGLFEDVDAGRPVLPVAADDQFVRLAGKLPDCLYLGTSSWSFPGWQGIVYARKASAQRLAREGLWAYARHPLLRTVGIDRTYYAPVTADVLAAYAEQVPARFRFVVKAHEASTVSRYPRLERYGERAGERNPLFLDPSYAGDAVVAPFVDGLGARGGLLLFQFPPLGSEARDGARFAQRLHAFLSALPRGPVYAVELRNANLFTGAYLSALADVGAVHCVNVHPSMPPVDEQAHRTADHRSPAALVRWMLHAGLDYDGARERYQPFDQLVDEDRSSRAAIAELCRINVAAGRPTFVIANNKAEGSAPLSVTELAREIASA